MLKDRLTVKVLCNHECMLLLSHCGGGGEYDDNFNLFLRWNYRLIPDVKGTLISLIALSFVKDQNLTCIDYTRLHKITVDYSF